MTDDWRNNPDARDLLAQCRRVNDAFGGGLKLEYVAIDGVTVAGFEIVPDQNTIVLTGEQVERLSGWDMAQQRKTNKVKL